jgi:hypothetical protein
MDAPHVKVGNRYRMEEGEIQVDSIKPIGFPDITPALRASRDSRASLICSRLQSTAKARVSISFGSTTCLHARSAQVSASLPEEGLLLIQTATCHNGLRRIAS